MPVLILYLALVVVTTFWPAEKNLGELIALSAALSKSEVVHRCASEELVRYALGRAPVDVELSTVDTLTKAFMQSGGDIRSLLVAVATSPTFRTRLVEEN